MYRHRMAVFQVQNYQVGRLVSVFSNRTDELVAEYPLSSFDLPRFRRQFGVSEDGVDSEMVLEYEVKPKDVDFLAGYLAKDVRYDFDNNAYFLSCYRVSE